VPLGLTHQAFEPSFSPDASQITYEDVLTEEKHSIFVAGIDGTGKRQITQGPDDRQPNWSPRGDLIIFQRRVSAAGAEERWALFTMKPDGSSVNRVSPTNQDATDASFSSDGARIVYSAATDDEDGASLWIAGVDGSSPKRLTHSAPYDGAPSFTPDGRSVAFETTQGADESPTDLMWIAVPSAP
jgi:TolB protein